MPEEDCQKTSVFLLTGQSNSLGTTVLEEGNYLPPTHPADCETRLAWSNVDETSTGHPPRLYGSSEGKFLPLQIQQGGREDPHFWGPEIGFARTMHDAGCRRLVIIKASRGGGGNSFWDQRTFLEDAARGHMWGHLCNTIDKSLSCLVASGEQFTVRGFLYLQGESNSVSEAVLADTRLEELIDNLKEWIEQKFPKTAGEMQSVVGEIAACQSNPERAETNRRQIDLSVRREDIVFVPTHDLPLKSDELHFGRDAKLEIGRRMAVALLTK